MRVAVDVGGTFTDVIVLDETRGSLRFEKVETVPTDPARGVLSGFDKAEADINAIRYFVHGTTLALNALLTRTGARVAIVTTRGFRDVYELGRNDREPMYDFKYRKPESLVPRSHVFEVDQRMGFQGQELSAFNEAQAREVAQQIAALDLDAVAVCFLHAYANPAHEQRMREVLAEVCPGLSVTLSSDLSREYREYERTSTAVIDAYVKPITRSYLEKLDDELAESGLQGNFLLTRSGGGAMTVETAKHQPVQLILSGPAGGVIGSAVFGELTGHRNLITFDMGGTSLDVSLIAGGEIHMESQQRFQGLPISIPTIDIHTLGTGGGSIAWVDDGGHLQVGPQSAGADPGPVCYDKGGSQVTFTDAALAVGYLDPANFLGGDIQLNADHARQAIASLAEQLGMSADETAAGILRISEAKMAGAVRVISVERGFHPGDFTLLAFGGGGAFVGAAVARELGLPRVVVPPGQSNFSAFGMLMIDLVHDFSQTHVTALEPDQPQSLEAINAIYADLHAAGNAALDEDGFSDDRKVFQAQAELRYQGQEHTVNVGLPGTVLQADDIATIIASFGEAHRAQYGHAMDDKVEVVTLRLRALGLLPRPEIPRLEKGDANPENAHKGVRPVYQYGQGESADYQIYDRERLLWGNEIEGPAIVEERTATTVIHAGDRLGVGEFGELIIEIGAQS